MPANRYTYTLLPASTLKINGTTNVHDFSCLSKQVFEPREVFSVPGNGRNLCFQQAELALKASNLDCGSQGINRDMQKALKADRHPHIFLRVHEVQTPANNYSWQSLTVHASLTLAGLQRNLSIPVQYQQQSPHRARVRGTYQLHLTDFGIEPPKAMLGLIQVKDLLLLEFDLHLEMISS